MRARKRVVARPRRDRLTIYGGNALEALDARAGEAGVDMATFAFAWLLSDPRVTAVIVGPRRPEHLEPAVRALELELSAAERAELSALFD